MLSNQLINILLHANAKTGKGLNIDFICLETINTDHQNLTTTDLLLYYGVVILMIIMCKWECGTERSEVN